MQLTVADVLALPVVAAGRPEVRVGGAGLRAPVRWVHVSELTEVAGTLQGGELILSTGMGLLQQGFDGRAYLRSLRDAGAVGLVVELGQHVQRLDDDLVRAARAARLPLIELARNVRFVTVTEAVHALILNDQYERLQFSERVLEEFSAIGLGTATTAQVLERATALIERTVVLEDLSHRAVSFAGGPGAEVLLDWEPRSRRVSDPAGGPEGWVTTPVGPAGERWGRLVVPSRVTEADRRSVTLVLDRAAEALTVVRLLDREPTGMADRAAGDLLQALIGSTRADEPELRARVRALGLPLRGVLAPLVVRGINTSIGDDVSQVARALARAGVRGVSGRLAAGGVGVLLSGGDATALALSTKRLLGELAPPPAGASPSLIVVGGGEPAETLVGAGEGLLEAAHVARVAERLPGREPGRVYRNADLGARGLLWWMRDDPRLTAFTEGQLAPLLTGDPARVEADLSLLLLYLTHAGSSTRLAEATGISRPAVYARIQRLETRLARPLADPETRLSLHLALLARDLYQAASTSTASTTSTASPP